jgi:hypothetical protein
VDETERPSRGAPGPRITTAPVVAAAPGAVAEKQSSRERTECRRTDP